MQDHQTSVVEDCTRSVVRIIPFPKTRDLLQVFLSRVLRMLQMELVSEIVPPPVCQISRHFLVFQSWEITVDHHNLMFLWRINPHYVKRFLNRQMLTLPPFSGSTYAREIAFTEQIWHDRLANPGATTFLAIQSDRAVGITTLVGPLPVTAEE
jgi:hypothetical protein